MSIAVLGIPMFDNALGVAVEDILLLCETEHRGNLLVSATGAHGLVYSKRNREFKETLQNFYRNLPDGIPAVWLGRLKGAKGMERCYGPDVFREILRESAFLAVNHYFCGGKEGVAEQLKKTVSERFGNDNCVGTFCPPFREMSDQELQVLAEDINSKNTDIVWIGMSTPKQEIFAQRLAKYVNVHFIITVGAAFDYHVGSLKKAPSVVQKLGLEWFYRLLQEPRRLWKRYVYVVPMFLYYALIDLWRYERNRI